VLLPAGARDDEVVARDLRPLGAVVGHRDRAVMQPVVQGIGAVDRDELVADELDVDGHRA
jgi:hypothetical protein